MDPSAETFSPPPPPEDESTATAGAPPEGGSDEKDNEHEDSTSTDESTEESTERIREVKIEQQKRELNYIADTLINRKTEEALSKRDLGEDLTQGEKRLIELNNLTLREDGDYTQGEKASSIPFTKGKPVFIEVSKGRRLQLLSITGRRTDKDKQSYFVCQFKVDDGATRGYDIPVDSIFKAQYLTEADIIAQDFSPQEQQLLNLQAEALQDGESALKSKNSRELNELITNVSDAQGILTATDIGSFLDSQAGTATPEQQAQLQKAREILETMNTLTDGSQIADVLTALGISQDGLANETSKLSEELQLLQQQLDRTPNDEELKEQIIQKQQLIEDVQSIQSQVAKGLDFTKYFEHVRTGRATPDQRQALAEAMRKGDLPGILAAMPEFADDPKDTPEEKAGKEAKRQELAGKIAAGGIIGIGMVLGLFWKVLSVETRELNKSIK